MEVRAEMSDPQTEMTTEKPVGAASSLMQPEDQATSNESKLSKSFAFYLGFMALLINSLVFSLDATSLAVALPSIAKQLNGTVLQSFWANISYLLCVVITQPFYTTVSDTFGRKPPLYAAFLLFTTGSLAFALAPNMATVLTGRILQGLGGGGLDLLGEIIVADITTLQERSLYLGLMALPIAIGTILGPTMGALFSTYVSWRWIGWINLPLLAISFPMVIFFLRTRPVKINFLDAMKGLDWVGIFLSFAGITLFVLPLSWAGALYPWAAWQTLLPLIIGIVLLVALGFYEKLPASPVMPHRLFLPNTAKWTLLGNFIEGAVLFTILQYLPIFYQAVELQTIIGSAVTLIPTSIACVIAAMAGVILVGVIDKGYVWTIRFFWVELTIGTGLLALLNSNSSRSMLFGLPILWSIGVGALMRLLHLPMQASVVDVDDTGNAIGLVLTFRLLGGLIGLAIGSTVFNSLFADAIANIGDLPAALGVLRDESVAIGFIPQLRTLGMSSEGLTPVLNVYLHAIRGVFYTMTGFCSVGFLSSIFTGEHSLQRTELGRQRFDDSN